MLDIVAPHQNQPALGVDMGSVDHGEAILLGPETAAETTPARGDAPDDPCRQRDEQQNEDEGDDESGRQAQLDP
ncbi:hypothetical protein [Microbaculum marinum]|uniref:Uncharacterized protein n=1 Tax=Microbaculum marinum TaxID=1764581 RepID=A0AAW9RVH9_9HYPH